MEYERIIKRIEDSGDDDDRCDECGCLMSTKMIAMLNGKAVVELRCSNKECKLFDKPKMKGA